MIRIDRAAEPVPATLNKSKAKQDALKSHRAAVRANPNVKLAFDKSIYGSQDVKDALSRTQHGKCAFCESKILHISPGDVEHFRPKAAYKQTAKQKLQRPGYWWLAYTWENLVLACEECNRRHKKNMFPISGRRARSSQGNLLAEQAHYIHPVEEDPSGEIKFDGPDINWSRCGQRGEITAKALGLDRGYLFEERKRVADRIKQDFNTIEILSRMPNSKNEVDALWLALESYVKAEEPYSAMAKDLLRELFMGER